MSLVRFRASSMRCRCLLVAYLTAALDLTTAEDVVVTSNSPLAEVACVDVSLRQNTTDAQPPAAKKATPKPVANAPTPKPGANSPTPKPGAKSPSPKPGAKSPTPKPGGKPKAKGAKGKAAKKKAAPTAGDLAASMKRMVTMNDFADARAAARVAHQFAKTAVKATRTFTKKYMKGKGKGKKLKIKACDQSDLHRKVMEWLKNAQSDSMKKVLGKKQGCGKGMAPHAAVEAATAILEAKVSGKVAGGQLMGRMGHLLAKTRELRAQVGKMKLWLAKGKKSGKKMAKKIKKKKSLAVKKKSIFLAAKAATAATVKAVAGGLSRCKARRVAEKAAAEAIAIHLLLQTAKKKGKGKTCAKGKKR
eukprot:TRINITY_DN169_c0_g1_i1.p1 TRINITY_DN169_c0_g1~~TRINITY_DN169_c0_g1_i1.p1  ORF type:complete len:361 (+),score=82.13 TRINITY_DN169_c0_g1_i1:80-1162(+)